MGQFDERAIRWNFGAVWTQQKRNSEKKYGNLDMNEYDIVY